MNKDLLKFMVSLDSDREAITLICDVSHIQRKDSDGLVTAMVYTNLTRVTSLMSKVTGRYLSI